MTHGRPLPLLCVRPAPNDTGPVPPRNQSRRATRHNPNRDSIDRREGGQSKERSDRVEMRGFELSPTATITTIRAPSRPATRATGQQDTTRTEIRLTAEKADNRRNRQIEGR